MNTKDSLLKEKNDNLTNITYKKLIFSTGNEFSKFLNTNTSVLKDVFELLYESNLLFSRKKEDGFKRWLEEMRIHANNGSLVFILMYNGKEFIGSVEGHRQLSERDSFFLSSVAIKKEKRSKGQGTKLLARAYAELSRMGFSNIEMKPKQKTELINEWLTGRLETEIKDKDGNIKIIKRQFKNGKYYSLDKKTDTYKIQIKLPRKSVAK